MTDKEKLAIVVEAVLKLMALSLTSVLLVGCGTKPQGSFCITEKPYYPTSVELKTMTKEQKQFHVSRNEYGETHCGWKAVR